MPVMMEAWVAKKYNLGAVNSKFWRFAAPALVLAGLVSGCAKPPPVSDTADYQAYQQQNDPWEPTNRVFYSVNDKIDRYAFTPLAKGYLHITNQTIRTHVGDFVTNIGEPGRLIYFAAGGKPRDAGTALVRFVVNSTVGVGGIFDPATGLGYPETDTDFGLTLAEWGIPVSVSAGFRAFRRARCMVAAGPVLPDPDLRRPIQYRADRVQLQRHRADPGEYLCRLPWPDRPDQQYGA